MQIFIMYNGKQIEYVTDEHLVHEEIKLNKIGLSCTICLEKQQTEWHFVESTGLTVLNVQKGADGKRVYIPATYIKIQMQHKYIFGVKGTRNYVTVYVQEYKAENQLFSKYRISDVSEINIGTDPKNTVVINKRGVQAEQLKLKNDRDSVYIETKGEVYINNQLIRGCICLNAFDTICFLGVKIVYLKDIIAINNKEYIHVHLHEINILDLQDTQIPDEPIDFGYFSRAPRQLANIETEKMTIEAPPAQKQEDKTPWFLTVGPAITMPMPMLFSMIINMRMANGGTGRGIGMYAGIMVSMVLSALLGLVWGQVRKIWQKKQDVKYEECRVTSYQHYIDRNRAEIEKRNTTYNNEMLKQFLTAQYMCENLTHDNIWLWNRNPNHMDFGCIRIGLGNVQNVTEIDIPKERFVMETDVVDTLTDLPKQFKDDYQYLTNVPVIINLFALNMLGVTGTQEEMQDILTNMVVHIAGLYSYTDVKMALCVSETEVNKYKWFRFLPHANINTESIRLYVYNKISCERIVAYLINIIQARMTESRNKDTKHLPHYVIFCLDTTLLESDAIRNYANSNTNLGITFVLLFGSIAALPNNCVYILQNDTQFKGLNILTTSIDTKCTIDYDTLSLECAEEFARNLASFSVKEAELGTLPTKVDYLDLLGISCIEQWNLLQHYKESRTYENIKGLIGVGCGGVLKYLDIHEKKHGPHGLVAGMTGSGKSEMLQTIILSWAMNYSPEELAFVLIDYKGGGMANLFENLPHVVGVITNLSDDVETEEETDTKKESQNKGGNSVTLRALTSIKSEINRRQAIFKRYKINHIDDYIKMYYQNEVTECLPHLVIISDEFAELRKQQHSFISELVSAARVGRSLGVHLILATQKPAGVVDEEIMSNSRYRLSLRVQDKADSMSMLKRPDAAFLTQIGRLYMQVGSDEIFEEIQAAYSGGDYTPQKQITADYTCKMITYDGALVEIPKIKKKQDNVQKKQSVIEACVDYVINTVKQYKIPLPKKLWMPFLPTQLFIEDLEVLGSKGNSLYVPYGLLDDVAHQQQYPVVFDCLQMGTTAIVGTGGCGKTTLLQTLLYTLSKKYTASDLQYYIYDYSSRTLKMFTKLPHCGGVILNESEEAEKAQRTLQLISDIVKQRRKEFDAVDVGSFVEYRNIRKMALIYLIIDNFATWWNLHGDVYGETLLQLLRDGSKYGIYVLITANTANEISYKFKQYINSVITLQLPERSSYREFWQTSPESLPQNVKGRGLTLVSGTLVEFQVALAVKSENEVQRNTIIKQQLPEIAKLSTESAKLIPVLPKQTAYSELIAEMTTVENKDINTKLLLGYTLDTISPLFINIRETFIFTISDTSSIFAGATRLLQNLFLAVSKNKYKAYCIQLNETEYVTDVQYKAISTGADIYNFVHAINAEYNKQISEWNQYCKENTDTTKTEKQLRKEFLSAIEPVFVFIDNINLFEAKLQSDDVFKMSVNANTTLDTARIQRNAYHNIVKMFEKGANYNIHFIIGADATTHTRKLLPIFKDVLGTNTGVHFGGCISMQSFVKGSCVGNASKQMQEMPIENAVYKNNGVESVVWIP